MSLPTEKPFLPNNFIRSPFKSHPVITFDSKHNQIRNPIGITMNSMANFSVHPHPQFNLPFSSDKWAVTRCPKPADDPSTGDHKANEAVEFRSEAESSPEKQSEAVCAAEKPEPRTVAMNLRPRRHNSVIRSAVLLESTQEEVSCNTRNRRADRVNKNTNIEKKKPFSIALTKKEIEDDIFAMTGSTRPIHMKKKRSRTAKKLLDRLFLGQELHLISEGRYRVRKGRN